MDHPFFEYSAMFRQNLAGTVEHKRDDIQPQRGCYMERALVEPADAAVRGTGPFRIYRYAVSPLSQILQPWHQPVYMRGDRKELSLVYGITVNRIIPHPVCRQHNHPRSQGKHRQQVQMGLVIANDDSRLRKVLSVHVVLRIPHSWHPVPEKGEFRQTVQHTVKVAPLTFRNLSETHIHIHQRCHHEHGGEYEEYKGIYGPEQGSAPPDNCSRQAIDEGKKAKKEQAQGYVDRLLAGEDYDKVYHEYQDLVAKEKAEAEAESKSDAESKSGNSSAASSAASSVTSSTSGTASDDTTSSGTSGSEEEEHDHEFLLSKTDTSPSEEFVKWAFELDTDKGGVYEDDSVYYAVVRRDIKEREDWLTENHSNVLHVMKDDDYKAMLNETAKDYALDLNNDALNKYKPENLKK